MTGKQLQKWRIKNGLSQEEVARAIGVVARTQQRREKLGTLSPGILRQLRSAAAKLKVPFP